MVRNLAKHHIYLDIERLQCLLIFFMCRNPAQELLMNIPALSGYRCLLSKSFVDLADKLA